MNNVNEKTAYVFKIRGTSDAMEGQTTTVDSTEELDAAINFILTALKDDNSNLSLVHQWLADISDNKNDLTYTDPQNRFTVTAIPANNVQEV